jgi:agmatinase
MGLPTNPGLIWPSPRTFFGAPRCDDLQTLEAQVAFLGVPYDAGTLQPYIRTGQSAGPAAARLASFNQLDYVWPPGSSSGTGSLGWFDIEAKREYLAGVTMADCGDVAIAGAAIGQNLDRISRAARLIAERGALVVAVGGDHSISFPVGRGMESFAPIDIVHFDAHADFTDHFFDARYSHGSQLRRLSELPFVRSITAIGLRNVWKVEYDDLVTYGAGIATTRDVLESGPREIVGRLVPEGGTLYVSIDIDVLDLPIVPGTTLPEPGGLSYRDLREALDAVARKGRVVGFDIVELDPPQDSAGATSRVTTWLIVHFLSSIFDSRAQGAWG